MKKKKKTEKIRRMSKKIKEEQTNKQEHAHRGQHRAIFNLSRTAYVML